MALPKRKLQNKEETNAERIINCKHLRWPLVPIAEQPLCTTECVLNVVFTVADKSLRKPLSENKP